MGEIERCKIRRREVITDQSDPRMIEFRKSHHEYEPAHPRKTVRLEITEYEADGKQPAISTMLGFCEGEPPPGYKEMWDRLLLGNVAEENEPTASPTSGTYFIGVDLSDPYAKHKRPCARALLTPDLHCTFDEWGYDPRGSRIGPPSNGQVRCIVAIDGPQGLSGGAKQSMRCCERQVGAAGKSPFDFPPKGKPYAGFVRGSVELFYELVKSGGFRLYGTPNIHRTDANLIEVYPGHAWRTLAGRSLPNKKQPSGRSERYHLLAKLGMVFDLGYGATDLPTHDGLDAALAAYVAYLFHKGETRDHGEPPGIDDSCRVIREGFIVGPR